MKRLALALLLVLVLSGCSENAVSPPRYSPPLSAAIEILEGETSTVNGNPQEAPLTIKEYFLKLFET